MPLRKLPRVGRATADVYNHVPLGSVIGNPAPIAATIACSTR